MAGAADAMDTGDGDMDGDAALQQALQMSMAAEAPAPAPAPAPAAAEGTPAAPAAAGGAGADASAAASAAFLDPDFVASLMGSLDGVNADDPAIQAALQQDKSKNAWEKSLFSSFDTLSAAAAVAH